MVTCKVACRIPTESSSFRLHLYTTASSSKEHLAIVYGDLLSNSLHKTLPGESSSDRLIRGCLSPTTPPTPPRSPILVRIHSECITGETFCSCRCDCGEQLKKSMEIIEKEGRGIVVYLRQEGRGIAYNLQDNGHDTVTANLALHHPADAREFGVACEILKDFRIEKIRLMTNNPEKKRQLEIGGISVVEEVRLKPDWNGERATYLKTKVEKMGHRLDLPVGLASVVNNLLNS